MIIKCPNCRGKKKYMQKCGVCKGTGMINEPSVFERLSMNKTSKINLHIYGKKILA